MNSIVMANNNEAENTSAKKQTKNSEERDPVTDIRLPLMILFLSSATFSYLLELPPWVTLSVCAVFAASWAFAQQRALMVALLRNWRSGWLIIAPVLALLLYGLLEMAIQTVSDSLIHSGALAGQKELPTLFKWLLILRASAGNVSPMVLGLAGGLLLGTGEELFWRGFVQTRLMIITSHGVAVLITAILYSVFYLFALGTLAALLALFLGIMLSMLTLRSRSLLPAVLCHATFLIVSLWLRPDIAAIL